MYFFVAAVIRPALLLYFSPDVLSHWSRGRIEPDDASGQFAAFDERSIREMETAIAAAMWDPAYRDHN